MSASLGGAVFCMIFRPDSGVTARRLVPWPQLRGDPLETERCPHASRIAVSEPLRTWRLGGRCKVAEVLRRIDSTACVAERVILVRVRVYRMMPGEGRMVREVCSGWAGFDGHQTNVAVGLGRRAYSDVLYMIN